MIVLVCNALLFVITTIIMQHKLGMRPLVFLWMFYSIFAVFSVILVSSGLYFTAFSLSPEKALSFEPYIYNYYCMLVMTLPLYKITGKESGIKNATISSRSKRIFKVIFFIFIIYFGCKLFELSLYGNMGYAERHKMITQEGEGISIGQHSTIIGYITGICTKLYQILYPLAMFYVLLLLKKRTSLIKIMLLFSICIAPMLTGYVINGNRAGMFYLLANLAFFFFIIKDYLSKKQLSKIYLLCGILALILLSFSSSISEERFQHTDIGTAGSVSRYFGEVFPNLGYQYWNEVRNYTMGARKFGSYYSLLTGINFNLQGFDETFSYWSFFTGVDCALFKTVFGDLYLEFGTIGALVFASVFSLGMFWLTKNSELSIYNLPFYYYYFAFCTNLIFDIGIIYTSTNFLYILIGIFILQKWLSKKKIISITQ